MAQVCEVISQEDLPSPELLSLLLNCLYGLSKLDVSEAMVKSVFEFRCACLAGYMPELQGCIGCGNPIPERFDVSAGHLECVRCRSRESDGIRMPVTQGLLSAMRYIAFCDSKRLFSFSLSEEAMELLSQLTETYLITQLERSFSTLDFYKSLLI